MDKSGRPDIMYVIGTLQVGGAELHLQQVASALVARGWRISLCSLSGDGPLREAFERAGVEVLLPPVARGGRMNIVERLLKLSVSAAYLFLLSVLRRPRIIHFFLPRAYLTGAPLATLARLPIRVMSRRSLNVYQAGYPILRRAERLCHRTMTAVLGNSMSVMKELRDEGIPEGKLGLIYNGVDLARFECLPDKWVIRRSLGIDANTIVLCIVANLISYKGHKDLFEALAIAAAEIPDWHLLIVGRDDGIGEDLRLHAAKLAIDAHISFLGSRTDVPALLAASDIALSCSHQEGFSNAILEAMASGLPTIVTRVGGNQEAVVEGETGLIVPPCGTSELAAAIAQLVNDAALRRRFGRAGRQRVTDVFSFERCVQRYDVLYRALLEGRRPVDAL